MIDTENVPVRRSNTVSPDVKKPVSFPKPLMAFRYSTLQWSGCRRQRFGVHERY